jgi:hypothetical protein
MEAGMQEEMIKGFSTFTSAKHLWLLQQEEQAFFIVLSVLF